MRSCREVFKLLSQQPVEELSWRRRLGVRFHFLFCEMCRRYRRQMQLIEALAGQAPPPDTGLDPETKRRILNRLQEERENSATSEGTNP